MLTSARRGISYPNPDRSDRPDIPAHIGFLVAALEVDLIYALGTNATRLSRPHMVGTFFYETDTGVSYFDDGTTWQNVTGVPVLTTSLPGSPYSGQQITLTDNLASPTYAWQLIYDLSATKWLNIGGSDKRSEATANLTLGFGSSWTTHPNLASITVPVAGVYRATVYSHTSSSGGSSGTTTRRYGISINGATPTDQVVPQITYDNSAPSQREFEKTYAASDVLTFQAQQTASPVAITHANARISLAPVRLG